MALTFAAYALPQWERPAAAAVVVVVTAVNYVGLRTSVWLTRVLLAVVLAVLVAVVAVALGSDTADPVNLALTHEWPGFFGLLGAAGMLFFAFAGFARVTTLGGEVRRPESTIPRAVTVALGGVLALYLAVGVSALLVMGRDALARSVAPLVDTVEVVGWPQLVPVVVVGAAVASLGALLTLVLGVSRTAAAMASDGHLPGYLAGIHPRFGVPHRAQVAVGAVVLLLVLLLDVAQAIAFSAFGVLVYYAVANASALLLGPHENRPLLLVPVVGLAGCVVLAFSLPLGSVISGGAVLVLGATVWLVRRGLVQRRHS